MFGLLNWSGLSLLLVKKQKKTKTFHLAFYNCVEAWLKGEGHSRGRACVAIRMGSTAAHVGSSYDGMMVCYRKRNTKIYEEKMRPSLDDEQDKTAHSQHTNIFFFSVSPIDIYSRGEPYMINKNNTVAPATTKCPVTRIRGCLDAIAKVFVCVTSDVT